MGGAGWDSTTSRFRGWRNFLGRSTPTPLISVSLETQPYDALVYADLHCISTMVSLPGRARATVTYTDGTQHVASYFVPPPFDQHVARYVLMHP